MGSYRSPEFAAHETHGFVDLPSFDVIRTSEGLGWASAFLSEHIESPYVGSFSARDDILVSVVNAGNLEVNYRLNSSSQEIQAAPGSVFIVPNGTGGQVDLRSSVRTTHLYMRRSVLEEVADSIVPGSGRHVSIIARSGIYEPLIEQLCNEAREAAQADPRHSSLYIDHIVRALAAHLLRKHSNVGVRAIDSPRGTLNSRSLNRIKETIESRLADELSVSDLADELGMCPDHLGRLFKRTTGTTLYQFVIRCRVDRARRLLSETRTPTAAIAFECGFSDQVSLTRTFRRVVGTTPAAFRQQSQASTLG